MNLSQNSPHFLYFIKICHVKYLALQVICLEEKNIVFYVLNSKLNKGIGEHSYDLPTFHF